MGLASNTLKGSDVSVTPIKLKYSNDIPSSSLASSGITLTVASNASYDMFNPSFTDDFLLYRSVRGLYYMNFISGSASGSAYEWYPQSTAASGTFDNDYRYFPTESNAQVLVISIPRAKFGENIARASFSITATDNSYNIVDDGNGNLIDTVASNVHVGNLLYNQGIGVVTNSDYVTALTPTPPCAVPIFLPFNSSDTTAVANWTAPGDPTLYYEYVYSTSSATPTGTGTSILADLGTLVITGLTPSTTYYFFLRSRCSVSNYSSWVSQSFATQAASILVPFRDGLILELESFTGSNYDGSNKMISWDDMSGYGNTLYSVAPTTSEYYPIYTASYSKGQPGIYFSASSVSSIGSAMKTQANLSGLSGSTGMTLFVVGKFENVQATGVLVEYAKSGSTYTANTGSFMAYNLTNVSNIRPAIVANGNVGQSNVQKTVGGSINSMQVLTTTVDFTLSTREAAAYLNNVSESQTYTVNANNSGSFDEYKLSLAAPVKDGQYYASRGYITSVLLYNKVLTDSERTIVYSYLSSSYI